MIKEAYKRMNFKIIGYDIFSVIIVMVILLIDLMIINSILPYEDVKPTADKINEYLATQGSLPELNEELSNEISDKIASIQMFFAKITAIMLFSFILMIMATGFTRGRVYMIMDHPRAKYTNIRRFILINSIWVFSWIVILILAAWIMKPAGFVVLAPFGLAMYLHLSVVLRSRLAKGEKKLDLFERGIRKIPRYIVPALIVAALYFVYLITAIALLPTAANWLSRMFPGLAMAIALVTLSLMVISLVLLTTWSRAYYSLVDETLSRK